MTISSKILILYGSQTGTAQDVAERIFRESKFFKLNSRVMSMDDYAVEQLIYEPVVLFVTSTTGQGEEPDNMKTFWKFLLKRSLPATSLCNVKFGVLGLGDSSYVKFNFVAKRLTRRLSSLGGTLIVDTGYADDQHDLGADAVVNKWIDSLWTELGKLYNFTAGIVNIKFEPRWNIDVIRNSDFKNSDNVGNAGKRYSRRSPCELVVNCNTRTTPANHFQDVRLIRLRAAKEISYKPGDVLMLVPQNSDENVERLFSILNEERREEEKILRSSYVQVTAKADGLAVPADLKLPIRLDECAKKYWDLNAVPRRYVFDVLSQVSTNELEREKLKEFSDAAGLEELYNYCNRPKRTILEVLSDFPHTTRNLSIAVLFDLFQPIKPRAFSIASSPLTNPGCIEILLAVVSYKTKLMTPRQGLCSTFLSNLPVGSILLGWIQDGSFRFPGPGANVIMVGPGTGVAPFRSYIHDLAAANDANHAHLLLIFGCRSQSSDFHFENEWMDLVAQGRLTMISAFSRDQPDKVYVQHKIEENSAEVWKRMSNNATILVAGSSKNMPQSVREAFVKVAEKEGGLSSAEAEAFIANLERRGMYQTETWG